MKQLILALAGTGLLMACAAVDTSPPQDTHLVCQTRTLDWAIGKKADEALVRRAQLESTSKLVRVLHPGQMVTMEFNDQRLNIRVDNDNVVLAVTCG